MGAADLGFRDIIGTFYARLEEVYATSWAPLVSMEFNSDQSQEEYKWLGMAPALREWISGRKAKSLRSDGITILNRTFEATIGINADDWRRDKTGQTRIRVQELADRSVGHWHKLLTTMLEDNPTCYDAQNFFDTDHSTGDSGTLNNAVTATEVGALNVTDVDNPTAAEMEKVITGLIQHMMTFKDDQGEPMNDGAKSFVVMVPTKYWAATAMALNLPVIIDSGASRNNLLVNLAGYNFVAHANPRLTSTNDYAYVFRSDASAKAMIRQIELDEGVRVKDDTFDNNEYKFGLKAIRNVGPGYWQYAIRGTLS